MLFDGHMTESALHFLTSWFADHCDGDWEHDLGITIETLDNPGWTVRVRTAATELSGIVADWHRSETSEQVWLQWRATGDVFEAACGPNDLARALAAFQRFAQEHSG